GSSPPNEQPPANADQPPSGGDQAPGGSEAPPSNPDSPPPSPDAPAGSGAGGRLGTLCRQLCSSLDSVVDRCSQGMNGLGLKLDCGGANACQVPAGALPCENEIAG